jgi:hypothetical protein
MDFVFSDFYIASITEDKVFLVDKDLGGRSVTNDRENVWNHIESKHPSKRIIYKDSMGRWDEFTKCPAGTVDVIPYNEEIPS